MKIKLSVHLKSGKVISRIKSNLDQKTMEYWVEKVLEGLLEDEKGWLSIGELPSKHFIPIGAIECISFEELTQN